MPADNVYHRTATMNKTYLPGASRYEGGMKQYIRDARGGAAPRRTAGPAPVNAARPLPPGEPVKEEEGRRYAENRPETARQTASLPAEAGCAERAPETVQPQARRINGGEGLLAYRKWWFERPVDVRVGGETLSGMPLFLRDGTLRVVGDKYSYFIPLERIDYIRTPDGLDQCDYL